jgi:hypothetical protein
MSTSVSTTPFWGQAWQLDVTYATAGGSQQASISSKTWEPAALRMTFDVLQAMNTSPFWYADISIYNLNDQTLQNILLNASWATLKAGFQTGPNVCGTIWDGPVFQTIFTREDVVDQKLTLHCVANPFVMDNIVSFATGPFSSQAQLVSKMASQIGLPPITNGQGTLGQAAGTRLSAVQYPRGNTVFGKTAKYLSQISDSAFLQQWQDGQQAYISEVDTGNRTPAYVYSPPFPPGYNGQSLGLPNDTNESIIGTPQQIQQGVVFTVLLDPRLKVSLPPLLVQLARTQVAQLVRTPSINSELPTALTSNLLFFVAQVRHTGDTRGNDWQTEVTGWSTAYAQTLLNLYT